MRRKQAGTIPVVNMTSEALVPGGDALARHEGKVVFIPGALPGEEIRVALVERKKDFDRGEIVTVLKESPDRIQPPCPHADSCGGCDWQHINHEAQLRHKVDLAKAAYLRLGGFAFPGLGIESGPPFGYRNRMQLHVDRRGGFGFKARRSHDVIAVDHCPIAHESLQTLFSSTSDLRPSTRLHVFGHPTVGDAKVRREDDGQGPVEVTVLGKTFAFGLRSFFQSNLEMLERLLPFALEGLSGQIAWDLYSGVGLFAAFLQERFEKVMAIESDAHAADFIRRNTRSGIEIHAGRVEDLLVTGGLDKIGEQMQPRPDAIVVDPPREGLHVQARQWLVKVRAPKLVYVACDVVSQARDLKTLLAAGYRLDALRLFDFYPQTHHLEAVARLTWVGDE